MNIIFYTTDLYAGRERLMPWRTVLEIARIMQKDGKSKVIVLNGVKGVTDDTSYTYHNVHIQGIHKNLKELAQAVHALQAEVLFIECKWRDAIKGFSPLNKLECKKYAYFTGGVYDFKSACLLSKIDQLKNTRAYWLENVIPKTLIGWRLRQAHFDGAVGLTPYTTDRIRASGIDYSFTILPGKDNFEYIKSDESILQKYHLKNCRFLCFTGAPAPTRGAQILLMAADKSTIKDLKIVFLMRKDVGSDFSAFNATYKQMKHPERIIIINECLSREQLKAFFSQAWYMILPFIVIPSEIPLTFFEIMSCGTPVLTFENGGTSKYLLDGLLIAKKSKKGLRKALEKAWSDFSTHEQKAKHAQSLLEKHPTWEQIAKEWSELLIK